jgi:F-type H+-transporting ATPase subunit gamma
LLEARETTRRAVLLVLTGNRGLCGGYNGNVLRIAMARWSELNSQVPQCTLEVSGKRGIGGFKFRNIIPEVAFTHFEDKPSFEEVEVLANRYLEQYITGKLDRLDVAYTRFFSISKQTAVVETLLPLGSLEGAGQPADTGRQLQYEFMPSAESILEEVVPTSFKVKLFKCFLDAAVSEQVARMVAMKSATENADNLIKSLSMTYNRARQGQITSELLDIVGGVEALNK